VAAQLAASVEGLSSMELFEYLVPTAQKTQCRYVRFVVFTAVNINITVVWYVTPCNLVGKYQFLEGICCLHLQDRRVAYYTETLVPIH
jgi:hypothetical protein